MFCRGGVSVEVPYKRTNAPEIASPPVFTTFMLARVGHSFLKDEIPTPKPANNSIIPISFILFIFDDYFVQLHLLQFQP